MVLSNRTKDMQGIEVLAGVLTSLTEVIQEQEKRIKVLEGSSEGAGAAATPEKVVPATDAELDAIMKNWRV